MVTLDRCPREIMGPKFIHAVNYASICGRGDWPVAGGLTTQAAWFVSLYQTLKAETGRIRQEKLDRAT